jgi:uncharacterized membrane protein YtjA (UPF0391 family)
VCASFLVAAMPRAELEVSVGRNYQRAVTPESNLNIACRKCGHVTRAFDERCPSCGARLGGRHTFPFIVAVAMLFAVLALLAGVLGFMGLAGTSSLDAKVLFLVFMAMFVVSLVFGRR